MEANPSFAMVLIKKDFCNRLQIPKAFIKEFGRHLPNKILIQVSFDKSWEVDVEKIDEGVYFTKGWQTFVRDNNVELKNLLVFEYFAFLKFQVTIYGSTSCAKKVHVARGPSSKPVAGERIERKVKNPRETKWVEVDVGKQSGNFKKAGATRNKSKIHLNEVKEEEVIYLDCDSSDSDQTGNLKQSAHKRRKNAYNSEDSAPPRKRVNTNASSPTDKAKEFKSKNPCFQVELTQTYARAYLGIPRIFSKEHLKGRDQDIKLKILEKLWDSKIGYITSKSRTDCRIIGGWRKFSRANGLKVGDVCVFEMVRSDDIIFNVHIYKC